jgi:hypothetical protein
MAAVLVNRQGVSHSPELFLQWNFSHINMCDLP